MHLGDKLLQQTLIDDVDGRVVAVSRSPRHGFAKDVQTSIRLVEGEGVEGDAHRGIRVQHLYQAQRDPMQPNLCQVHLFAAEMLEELAAAGYALGPGEMGENVLTRGLDLLSLPRHTWVRLGEQTVLEITGLRTPCIKIDKYRAGLQRYLWGPKDRQGKRTRRAGVMATVRTGGQVFPNDEITLQLPPKPFLPLGPV